MTFNKISALLIEETHFERLIEVLENLRMVLRLDNVVRLYDRLSCDYID